MKNYSRRQAIKSISSLTAGTLVWPQYALEAKKEMGHRKIPSTGELLPLVGLGTWQSFDAGNDQDLRKQLTKVLLEMYKKGGRLIDSSPMYGSSEKVVGDLTSKLRVQDSFFYATKVWTSGKQAGVDQIAQSMQKMKRSKMDLIQIHNLVDWKTHLATLKEMKAQGQIGYWGVTHYTDSSHAALAKVIKDERPDFVQFNYSIMGRHAEKFLLNTAKEQGTAVIINRPFEGGSLFRKTKGKALPPWCAELEIASWAQYFLKYILSEEAVNCVIPGTSKPHHVVDNMMAGHGKLPNLSERKKMLAYIKSI
ncbi:aldo/keto reductase [Pseudozobellia thermophila]|uniref:Aldo/keto reductase n=1 Tax=Pseudozobellia thermophila TaxID=192903 RepID=A0A1M6FXF9_9FLAO|nr:aldo/keto reductase [Pseudozobellia thermophila]SHJ02310.1 Aldo/keto reductase [Pseudozobellia thermophila]